jgi:hypothetical protein
MDLQKSASVPHRKNRPPPNGRLERGVRRWEGGGVVGKGSLGKGDGTCASFCSSLDSSARLRGRVCALTKLSGGNNTGLQSTPTLQQNITTHNTTQQLHNSFQGWEGRWYDCMGGSPFDLRCLESSINVSSSFNREITSLSAQISSNDV